MWHGEHIVGMMSLFVPVCLQSSVSSSVSGPALKKIPVAASTPAGHPSTPACDPSASATSAVLKPSTEAASASVPDNEVCVCVCVCVSVRVCQSVLVMNSITPALFCQSSLPHQTPVRFFSCSDRVENGCGPGQVLRRQEFQCHLTWLNKGHNPHLRAE